MLRDVFYFGTKPNVHPKEQPAKNLVDARKKATTEHFWIINEFCDYTNFDWDFDFEFLPDSDVWAEDHNNVWPSLHQKDSGTWLCANNNSDVIVYRCDVEPLKRKNIVTDNWKLLENIDTAKWDFSWHPDPTDPPFIYKWGSKYAPAELSTCLEYHVPGATDIKYMNTIVELLPNWDSIVEVQKVDSSRWDMSWRPDPMDPPYIYVWGNKYVDGKLRSTLEYHVPGATEKKYMNELVPVLPEWDRWDIIHDVDKTTFDFSWRPDPREPDFIYVFGNDQYEAGVMPTIEYHMSDATERKYLHDMKAKLSAHVEKFEHLEKADGIDYSWVPDPTAPPYIYAWGNQWNKPEDKVSIQYVVEGATEYKFMEARSKRKPCMDNWEVPDNVDTTGFDFSWEPSPADPAFIYEFGTQWQKTGGPRYVVEGATEVKYVEFQKVKALSTTDGWTIPTNCDVTGFDFSWHPDSTSPPYTYHFATQWALTGGPIYNMEGATEVKYVEHPSAIALPSKENWDVPDYIDSDAFDFSWHPYVEDQPYVYQFGTQHQKTGGPRYITPGVIPSSPVKYIDTRIIRSIRKPSKKNFAILNNYKIKEFDWSWHPDDTDEPYIYVFGNTQHPAEIMPTIEYVVPGATQIKYVSDVIAVLDVDMTNWEVPDNTDSSTFDFSWRPNPKDPPFIYEFGTQWQKTGGPRYVVPDADEVKYVTTQQVTALPTKDNWTVPNYVDTTGFDFSWHPDDTSPPYIYHFATQWALTGGPVYTVPGAIETKYLEEPSAVALPNKDNWEVPTEIDADSFDFSWHPYVEDQPYVYQFGTQHQKTGGPKYITPGVIPSSPVKYIDTRVLKATRKSSKKNFAILNNYKIKEFDFTWHPDDTDEPYIYVFGNNQHPAEIMPTIEYVVPGAKQIKYVNNIIAILDVDMTNWEVPDGTDTTDFDFSWKPNPKDPAFIYQFGTQWQKTGGPRYVVPGADEVKYVSTQKVKALPNQSNWTIPTHIDVTGFDFSWHPDDTSPAYIYHFATQWALTGGPIYTVPGAVETKYLEEPSAIALENKDNWEVPEHVDVSDFDFSWHPYIEDQPYVYQFGTQWQKTGGPKYITPGVIPSSPVKYIDTRILKSKRLPNKKNFAILNNYKIKEFDWSWHPDETDEPYIYVFGNTQYPAEIMPTVEYKVPGAKQIKYVSDVIAVLDVDMTNWEVPDNVDTTGFDFSWKPNPKDPAFIYEFSTQWQKTGGPRYVVPDATEVKYVTTQKVKALPDYDKWTLPENIDVTDFDFSWHPDSTSPPYNYHFATQWALSGGPVYKMDGAIATKYMDSPSAKALPNKTNWEIPVDIDESDFDFSWHPYAEDDPYIYQFGTQWQKTGGPRYVTPGAKRSAPVKYIDTRIITSKKLPTKSKFTVLNNLSVASFDWSWHPDDTDGEFIYVFGNTQYPAEVMPTIEYRSSPYAEKIKYINDVKATLATDLAGWDIPSNIDVSQFDFSWKPNPKDPAYIYQYGTQHQKTGGPRYIVPDATEVKYVDTIKATKLVDKKKFTILNNLVVQDFDYSWHPDDTEEPFIYIFGNNQYPAEIMPTVEYIVPGATSIKYINSITAKLGADKTNWEVPSYIDATQFDFSWKPNPNDPPYIYQFGTQHQKTGGPKYTVSGATEVKYVEGSTAKSVASKKHWVVPPSINASMFDFSWHPDDTDELFIYQFGTQWQKTGGPKYVPEGATSDTPVKYCSDVKSIHLKDKKNFTTLIEHDIKDFDYSWHPDDTEKPYIYRFGNKQHSAEIMPTIEYKVPGAVQVKYVTDIVAILSPSRKNWVVPKNIQTDSFDFSWIPNPNDPPYIYQFGTQHQKTSGPRYEVPGATDIKYVDDIRAKHKEDKTNWVIPDGVVVSDFDFSWHPDELAPPYVYQFGTMLDDKDGPKYVTPGHTGEIVYKLRITKPYENELVTSAEEEIVVPQYYIETTLEDLINQHSSEVFWALNKNIDYTGFDFDWRPEVINVAWESAYVHVFGSPDSVTTHTYFVNARSYLDGKKDLKFVEDASLNEGYLSRLFIKPDMFFVDRGNPESAQRYEELKIKFSNLQKTRYLNSWVDTINRCINRSTTELCWILNSELDYDGFDFNYYPNPWQMKMVHVFGTQWSHWGTTFMVNRETFSADTKYIKIIEHLSNLNFVKTRTAKATNVLYDVYYIDHGNTPNLPVANVVPYDTDYLTTFKNIISKLPEKKEHYIWIASTVCDYTGFDFTYICDPFAREQLHVFPSDKQKFGDTFLVNVNKLRELINDMESLKDYDKINFNQHQRTKRLEAPIIVSDFDSHVATVMQDFDFPYATFVTSDNKDIAVVEEEPMNLWDVESKNILITSTGGTRIVVPKEAKQYVETQLYDYPYIKTAPRLAKSNPLDIVFLSNGEKCAEENYEHLLKATKGLPNRIVRVDGVNGRVEAYHAAAEASNTPWMFTVFAKLKVNTKFDFNWQPDRLQIPKHYMFLAKNPVNGLIYGHQGMIAYNKQMTLDNPGYGLDFTLDSPHETIELLSGIATYNTDEWSTWRTAFREVIKLKKENSDISNNRLEAWLTKATGDFAQSSLDGAKDGIAYYNEVDGKTDKLKLSYEWAWLKERFNK